jgi:phage major head subunit gpT-like protein
MPTPISDSRLQALRDGFKTTFQGAFKDAPTVMDPLTTVVPSDAATEVYGFIEDSLALRAWKRGEQREQKTVSERSYTLTNSRFERMTAVNRDDIADDKLGMWGSVHVPMLGRAAKVFPDQELADILLNNATCYDGGPFFDPSHPIRGSASTYSNSVNLALDAANFATVRAMMRKFTDAAGKYRDVGGRFALVVGPELEVAALQLMNATTVTTGGENVLRSMADVIVVPQLSANANRWFLAAIGLPLKPLLRQVREGVTYTIRDASPAECVDLKNENQYGVAIREAYGVSCPWLMIASDPDAAMT